MILDKKNCEALKKINTLLFLRNNEKINLHFYNFKVLIINTLKSYLCNFAFRIFFGSIGLLLCLTPLQSQDIHFSQYWNAPLNLSPALTGVSKEDTRIFGAYKNQWASVPVGYKTFAAAF